MEFLLATSLFGLITGGGVMVFGLSIFGSVGAFASGILWGSCLGMGFVSGTIVLGGAGLGMAGMVMLFEESGFRISTLAGVCFGLELSKTVSGFEGSIFGSCLGWGELVSLLVTSALGPTGLEMLIVFSGLGVTEFPEVGAFGCLEGFILREPSGPLFGEAFTGCFESARTGSV